MCVVYNEKEFKKARRKARYREWFGHKVDQTKRFVEQNKELLAVGIPIFTGAVVKGVKILTKVRGRKQDKDLKELYCYDRSLGHYWKLRRELSNREWLEIDKRKKNGERLADILSELKVLK